MSHLKLLRRMARERNLSRGYRFSGWETLAIYRFLAEQSAADPASVIPRNATAALPLLSPKPWTKYRNLQPLFSSACWGSSKLDGRAQERFANFFVLEFRIHFSSSVSLEASLGSAGSALFSGRSSGNRITSRMVCESVSNMPRRSTPTPTPPAGGIPYESARI
jgi:hypothetical protein